MHFQPAEQHWGKQCAVCGGHPCQRSGPTTRLVHVQKSSYRNHYREGGFQLDGSHCLLHDRIHAIAPPSPLPLARSATRGKSIMKCTLHMPSTGSRSCRSGHLSLHSVPTVSNSFLHCGTSGRLMTMTLLSPRDD
jgi:hypothetical protein